MSKIKFEAAKELIAERRYDEARVLLRTIGHPTAEHWLHKLDKLDPPGAKSSPPVMPPPADYEPILRRWIEVEKTFLVVMALGFVIAAAYLAIANPLEGLIESLLFDKPHLHSVARLVVAGFFIVPALGFIRYSTNDSYIRRFVLRPKPIQFYSLMAITVVGLPFVVLYGFWLRGSSEDLFWYCMFLAFILTTGGTASWWCGKQAQAIRRSGYVEPERNKRSITINF